MTIRFAYLFLILVTALALFITLSGLLSQSEEPARLFQILFIPVTVFLIFQISDLFSQHSSPLASPQGLRKLLVYYCFVISTTLVIVSFLAAATPAQIVSSLLFTPLAVYFLILVWPGRQQAIRLPMIPVPPPNPTHLDTDRRDFLKLIGTAGIAAFIYSLFNRRTALVPAFSDYSSASSVALKDAAGNKIDPAEKSPTHGYYISQIDDSTIAYFGFVNKLGQWFIMRQDADNAYRYARGDRDFSHNWTNRAALTYDYFDNIF